MLSIKARKRHLERKHKIREGKKRQQLEGMAAAVLILVAAVSISVFITDSMRNQPSASHATGFPSQSKAAIVDQLSLTFPNETFKQTATWILERAGYTVDCIPGENVTVNFFRNLPLCGYRLIIFRVHSSATNPDTTEGPVTLFTSEPYDRSKYVCEQLSDQLVMVALLSRGA